MYRAATIPSSLTEPTQYFWMNNTKCEFFINIEKIFKLQVSIRAINPTSPCFCEDIIFFLLNKGVINSAESGSSHVFARKDIDPLQHY